MGGIVGRDVQVLELCVGEGVHSSREESGMTAGTAQMEDDGVGCDRGWELEVGVGCAFGRVLLCLGRGLK